MDFMRHKNLEGLHAPFSPSQSSWFRYDDERAMEVYANRKSAELGTRLHRWAEETIKLKIKQPKSKKTIYSYVNDAIGFNMETEVVLFYSERFFGTTDAISFRYEPKVGKNTLRIHDLKTGSTPVKMEQLEIYAALFCLEYRINPSDIYMELRIYQNDEILYHTPTEEDIFPIMEHIKHLDKLLESLEYKEG